MKSMHKTDLWFSKRAMYLQNRAESGIFRGRKGISQNPFSKGISDPKTGLKRAKGLSGPTLGEYRKSHLKVKSLFDWLSLILGELCNGALKLDNITSGKMECGVQRASMNPEMELTLDDAKSRQPAKVTQHRDCLYNTVVTVEDNGMHHAFICQASYAEKVFKSACKLSVGESKSSKSGGDHGVIIALVVSCCLFILILLGVVCYIVRRKKKRYARANQGMS